jgi:hypothetical protein
MNMNVLIVEHSQHGCLHTVGADSAYASQKESPEYGNAM